MSIDKNFNLVPRVLRLFSQRLVARRESGVLQDFCGKTIEAVTELIQSSQPKNLFFFEFFRVSPGAYPLTKKPEDSGYRLKNLGKLNMNSRAFRA